MRNEIEDLKQQAREYAKQQLKKQVKEAAREVGQQIWSAIAPILPWVIGAILIFIVIVGCVDWGDLTASASSDADLDSISDTIYGNTIQEKVWYGMTSLGFSEISTAAAMGNIHYESGSFNPEAIEGGYDENNGGIGICQWTNSGRGTEGRNTQLKQYASSKGTTWKDENIQVEFLMHEITGNGEASGYATYQLMNTTYTGKSYSCDEWINASDSDSLDEDKLKRLTEVFCFTFERPSADAGASSLNTRYTYALKYYNEFHGREFTDNGETETSFTGNLFTDSTGKSYKLYKQGSTEFKSLPYPARGGGKTIGANGCGPTSCAIIGSAYGFKDTPATLVKTGKCYSCYNDIPNYFYERGFIVEYYYTMTDEQIINKLSDGYDIVLLTKKGKVGNYSVYPWNHWYTLLDVNANDEVFVGDPIVKRWWMV